MPASWVKVPASSHLMKWAMVACSLLILADPARAGSPRSSVVVYVDAIPQDAQVVERVRQALHSRLLEEGFEVSAAPVESEVGVIEVDRAFAGPSQLRIEVRAERWSLQANGERELRAEVDARGEFDVVVLELLHKAVALLQGVGRDPPPITGELGPSPDADTPRQTHAAEPAAATPAVDEGPRAPSHWELAPVDERALDVATSPDELTEAKDPLRYVLGARVGWLGRGKDIDPVLSAQLFTTGRGLGLRAQVDYVASDPDGRLDVWEAGALAGPQFGVHMSNVTRLIVGAMFGARMHRFIYDARDQGIRWTWLAAVPVELRFETGRFSYGFGASLGYSGTSPTHVVLGTTTWQRSVLSWDVNCALGVRL